MTHPDDHSPGPALSGEALFGTAVAEYARYRPGVPDEAVQLLAGTLEDVPEPTLLDLGAGTGQVLLALLAALPRVAHVDLVDVNKEMLRQAVFALRPARTGNALPLRGRGRRLRSSDARPPD